MNSAMLIEASRIDTRKGLDFAPRELYKLTILKKLGFSSAFV